ncbi:MAG: four-helix bundle copper-binding protein [Pirellulales bacterium]
MSHCQRCARMCSVCADECRQLAGAHLKGRRASAASH